MDWDRQLDSSVAGPAPIASEPSLSPTPTPSASPYEFPEAQLHSALADLCDNSRQESDDHQWTAAETQGQISAFNELKRSLSERLSVSSSAEHLHLAALLDNDPESRIDLLDRAVSRNPNDAFLLWGAVQICSKESDATGCPLREWEKRLLEIDGQNSESWVRVAANRYEAGEVDSALEAMRYAATAAETRAYWTETIEMIERGFAAGSDYSFPERAEMAFGFAATEIPNFADYVTMCEERSANSVDWAYACLAYGELVEDQGKTEMGVSIAFSIQKLAFKALGDADDLAAVEQRRQARRQELLVSAGENYMATARLLLSSPAIFSAYLAAVRTHGEPGARAYLADETSRLLREKPELACEPQRAPSTAPKATTSLR